MNLTPKQTITGAVETEQNLKGTVEAEQSIKGTVASSQSLRGTMKDIPSLDNTLTKEGFAADAKAVGDALNTKAPISHTEDKGNPHGVTASQVGARPDTWMPSASEIGARPDTWTPTASQVGARPDTWMPTAEDVGARPDNWMPTAQEVGARPNTWTPTAQEVGARPNTWMPTTAEVGAIPKAGGDVNGYLDFRDTSAGLSWNTADGSIFHLRPWSPGNIFQLTMQNPTKGVAEHGVFSINTHGGWEFSNPAGVRYAIGAAPGGFGLGGVSQYVNSADEATQSGFYSAPVFPEVGGGGEMFGYVTKTADTWITQIWHYIGLTVKRDMQNGVWQPVEFFNPPMQPGVEYRTIERRRGQPEYVKLIDFGSLPASGVASIYVGIAGTRICYINATAFSNTNGESQPFPMFQNGEPAAYYWVDNSGNLNVNAVKNVSDNYAVFEIYYSKS